jgi:hypothetical protein
MQLQIRFQKSTDRSCCKLILQCRFQTCLSAAYSKIFCFDNEHGRQRHSYHDVWDLRPTFEKIEEGGWWEEHGENTKILCERHLIMLLYSHANFPNEILLHLLL